MSQIMSSHNTKTEALVKEEVIRVKGDRDELRVLKSTLIDSSELTVAEEDGPGGDPYNSTGRHVVIKAKLDLGD